MLSEKRLNEIKGMIGIEGFEAPPTRARRQGLPKSKATWKVYAQNPEHYDDQGVYVKMLGEAAPWQSEADCEEFDYFHNPSKEGWSIRDLESAQRWGEQFSFDVVEFELL